ncbi:hypothetical protein P8605_14500 [Streptomyces sp. T-3]|nr:hypothetical protein [Streptomyces sp. T-3]
MDSESLFWVGLFGVPAVLIGACLLAVRGRGAGLPGEEEATAGVRGEASALAMIVRFGGR